jgi:hypothetical protein
MEYRRGRIKCLSEIFPRVSRSKDGNKIQKFFTDSFPVMLTPQGGGSISSVGAILNRYRHEYNLLPQQERFFASLRMTKVGDRFSLRALLAKVSGDGNDDLLEEGVEIFGSGHCGQRIS